MVSTTPCTLSMVQCSRPDAMKRESSLGGRGGISALKHGGEGHRERRLEGMYVPINESDADDKAAREAVEGEAPVGLEELAVREDAHLADVVTRVRCEYAVRF